MSSFIEKMMDFDPSNLSVFSTSEGGSNPVNNLVYKTMPKNSKSEDGNYRATLRIINNPFDYENSIVKTTLYSMQDENGWFTAPSALTEGDRNCPIFKAWKELWFSGDERLKQFAKDNYSKREEQWVLVQIIEDPNFPELNGQIKLMKLPTTIWKKMDAKMNPSTESKKAPMPILDYLIGNILTMEVQPGPDDPKQPERKQREISYDLCDFEPETKPITKIDGTELFTDEELELIEEWGNAKTEYMKAKITGKETVKSKAAAQKIVEIKDSIVALYTKAQEYLISAGIPNLKEEKGYKPWDEKLTARVTNWINTKRNQAMGGTVLGASPVVASTPSPAPAPTPSPAVTPEPASGPSAAEVEDGLPF